MSELCQCCGLRAPFNGIYCDFCTETHVKILQSLSKNLAETTKLTPPNAMALLNSAIFLRNLEGEEAEARDILLRQLQALEVELEIATDRNLELAKDFVDLQSYAGYLEKTYNHVLNLEDYKKKSTQPEKVENSEGNPEVVDEDTDS